MIDFKSYFENIKHEPLKDIFNKYLEDDKLKWLSNIFLDAFGEKGLGLGSETSQINAVVFINRIDHYIKEVARIKVYGRYMDDSYIIHNNKEYLIKVFEDLKILFNQYGITLNARKTHITKLSKGFCFLKTNFYILPSGKILKKPCRDSITRERRKLKRQFKLLRKGIITGETIEHSYQSWKGSMRNKHARKTIFNMEKLYKNLCKANEDILKNRG